MQSATPNPALEALSSALSEVVSHAAASVVAVHSHRSQSSGFVWRHNLVVTAEEPLADEGEMQVALPGGSIVAAQLVGRDPTTDIALLRIEGGGTAPLALAKSAVAPGSLATVVGSERGAPLAALAMVASSGGPWQSLRGGDIDMRIELDASLRRKAEGGAVLDAAGRALGMAVFGPRRRVLVIPSATIERVASRLESHGRIGRGYLGLGLQPVRLDGGGVGAMVMNVDPAGPGAGAGISQGDVLVAWNGSPLQSIQSLMRGLGPGAVGSVVQLSLRRGGQRLDLPITIGERPQQ